MEKINTITVNGVTYEIGGSGSSGLENAYIIPLAYSELAYGDKNILDAFGGTDKYNEMVTALSEGKSIYIQLKNTLAQAFVLLDSSVVFISWYEIRGNNLEKPMLIRTNFIIIGTTIIGGLIKFEEELEVKRKLEVDIFDLTESSSNEDIKAALKDTWSFNDARSYGAVQKRDVGLDGVSIYAELGLFFTGNGTTSDYSVKISCNIPECFGKEKGGIITINCTSGTFSVGGIVSF